MQEDKRLARERTNAGKYVTSELIHLSLHSKPQTEDERRNLGASSLVRLRGSQNDAHALLASHQAWVGDGVRRVRRMRWN